MLQQSFTPQFLAVTYRSIDTTSRRSGPHRAAHDLLMVFVEANLMMTVESRMLSLVDGSVVLVPEGSSYAFSHGFSCRYYCLAFTLPKDTAGSALASAMLYKLPSPVRLKDAKTCQCVLGQMEQLHRHFQKPDWLPAEYSDTYMAASFTKLLLDVYALQASAGFSQPVDPRQQLAMQITSYLDTHFQEPITLDQLEKTFFLSRFHLCRLFREQSQMTIFEYVRWKKVQAACELLLSTQMDIASVCSGAGFHNAQSFHTAFKRHTGKTPLEFRKARKGTL